jgi:predicted metalloprotease
VGADLERFPGVPAAPPGAGGVPGADPDAELVDFVEFVVDDVQQTWAEEFSRSGLSYEPAFLELFTGVTSSGCGQASSAVGPFYCPLDETAYLDLDFFRELRARFGAPGDFAQAYVIAHEIGHHVQHQLGIDEQVRGVARSRPEQANELSIRQELQADCFAGVWAQSTYERGLLERGDLEEGLGAAAAVGDDRIQQQAGGRLNPESWTHGSAEQRTTWFQRGFESGNPDACDTFSQ